MYKEIVMRRKVSTIFIILIMVSTCIVVSDVVSKVTYQQYKIGQYLESLVAFGAFVFSIGQVLKCRVKYKYSIIADEFIIHRVKGTNQEVMHCIKIKDISCIKKAAKTRVISSKVYGCFNLDKDVYICKYKTLKGDKCFYFESSYKLVNRLNVLKNKQQIKNAG